MTVDKKTLDILLVSESQSCIDLVQGAFEDQGDGSSLVVARSFGDAKAYLKGGVPDAMIVDSELPDGRGIDLANGRVRAGLFPFLLLDGEDGSAVSVPDQVSNGIERIPRAEQALAAMPQIVARVREKWQLALEHRQTQRQLASCSERMDALAVASAGLAHDFNNVLHAVAGNIALAKEDQAGRPDTLVLLEQAETAIERAKQIVGRISGLASGTAYPGGSANVAQVVVDSTRHALVDSSVTLSLSLDDDLPPASIDECQLYRVLGNLMSNAVDAMPNGGRLTVRGYTATEAETSRRSLPSGSYVHISVGDTGLGIPEEHRKRIFEPFFSTKKHGKGIGLASVSEIVASCHGAISVDSQPGEGSTFDVFIPISEEGANLDDQAVAKPGGGRGLVLVVEPDTAARRAAAAILLRLNYEPLTAATAEAAVKRLSTARESGHDVEVVILDEQVAHDSGRSLVNELHRIDSELRVIVAGVGSRDSDGRPEAHEAEEFVRKPFQPEALALALMEAKSNREG